MNGNATAFGRNQQRSRDMDGCWIACFIDHTNVNKKWRTTFVERLSWADRDQDEERDSFDVCIRILEFYHGR